jgi:hypothetical protein
MAPMVFFILTGEKICTKKALEIFCPFLLCLALMKRGHFFILLIFLTSFLLPLSCACSSYNSIVEADFLTPDQKIEAVDAENLFIDKQNLSGVIPQPSLSSLFIKDNFLPTLLPFSFPAPLMHSTSSILRC